MLTPDNLNIRKDIATHGCQTTSQSFPPEIMPNHCAKLPLSFFLSLLAFGIAFEASADELDVINLFAGRSETRDTNLFRLPDNVDPFTLAGKHERSERISNSYAGILADKPLGLQKFHLGATYSSIRYQNYSNLGAKTLDYNAKWQWALTPELIGTLSKERNQSVQDYSNYRSLTTQNIVTSDRSLVHADWTPLGNWHLFSTLTNGSWINSQDYSQYSSSKYRTAEGGVKYVYPSGTSLAILYRKSIGSYLNRTPDELTQIDSGYRQYDKEFLLEWPITGKSRISARIGTEKRIHDNFSTRDYSGKTGRLSYTGDMTGKVFVTAAAERLYNSYQDMFSSYNIHDVKSIQGKWISSPKLSFSLRFDATRSNYYGAIIPSAPRNDRMYTSTLEFDWAPVKAVDLIGKTLRQRR
jgi:exopolysaccharide biosynthesis operon protein EpsL